MHPNTSIRSTRNAFTLLVVCVLLISFSANGQDLNRIGEKDPIKISGGINLSNIFYGIKGIDSRRDPYTYFLTGSLVFDLYGWRIPFSVSHSNQNTQFQQPFNQYSVHPTYKSFTAHIGYTSMTFSPYTLNGHLFKGVGLEFAPKGKFKCMAMYGRLQKAILPTEDSVVAPAYARFGYGIKASLQDDKHLLEAIAFRAKDQIQSLPSMGDSAEIFPQENLVVGITGAKTFFKKLRVQAEYASSAVTRNQFTEKMNDTKFWYSRVGDLYTARLSSSSYNAFKSSATFQGGSYSIGLAYERIDPEYRTLGAYYFNNDLENITLNLTKTLWKNKINIAANGGLQRDNLNEQKISTMTRWIGAVTIGYSPSEKLNVTTSYSNFRTFTNMRSQFVQINQLTPYSNLDTLNYSQVSQSASATIMYRLAASEKNKHHLNANCTAQDASELQGGVVQPGSSRFYYGNLSYAWNRVPGNWGLSLAFNLNQNRMTDVISTTLGPTVGLRKTLLDKKMKITGTTSFNQTQTNEILAAKVWCWRLTISYSIKKRHSLNVGGVLINREDLNPKNPKSYTEYTGTVGYSFSF